MNSRYCYNLGVLRALLPVKAKAKKNLLTARKFTTIIKDLKGSVKSLPPF